MSRQRSKKGCGDGSKTAREWDAILQKQQVNTRGMLGEYDEYRDGMGGMGVKVIIHGLKIEMRQVKSLRAGVGWRM